MAEIKINPIEHIKQLIKEKNNFVLNGGAGSGKTRTLVDVVNLIYLINNKNKIACITFTNVAADEIKNRIINSDINYRASTIHDFLWDIIKNYQKNLKQELLVSIETGIINYNGDLDLDENWFEKKSINYREWRKLEEGVISHNEVLKLANSLFKKYPLLRKILNDKFDFILIDEYQDTEKQVLEIFLDYLQQDEKHPIIGLFGDSMQSIYDKGIGDLNDYISKGIVKNVQKEDNWRCAINVIKLINKVRDDELHQKPAGNNEVGKITFLYSNNNIFSIESIKKHESFIDFDFSNSKENKELYLTHKLIAKQIGFENLLLNYENRDNLTGDNPDTLVSHLLKIQEMVNLYNNKMYNEFIKKTDYKILKADDKKILKKNIYELSNCSNKKIEEVINIADELRIVKKDDKLLDFINNKDEQYNKIKDLRFIEVVCFFNYKNEYSPYSTQHGIKGAEFDNVFVVLDNGGWNQYNFKYLFENDGNENVIKRTRKIFYVCCSRAKKNLIVFYHNPSVKILDKAKEWFGEGNVVEV